jgi:hypothetical protein
MSFYSLPEKTKNWINLVSTIHRITENIKCQIIDKFQYDRQMKKCFETNDIENINLFSSNKRVFAVIYVL